MPADTYGIHAAKTHLSQLVCNAPAHTPRPLRSAVVATAASYMGAMTLLTHDATVAQYAPTIVHV